MAKEVEFKVTGLKELADALDVFPAKIQQRFMTSALKAAAKPVVAAAKAKAAKASQALSDSITVKAQRRRQMGGAASSVHIGPFRDDRQALAQYADYYGLNLTGKLAREGIRHGHLVEFGHSYPGGSVPPRPFLRPALEGNKGALVTQFRIALGKRINSTIKRLQRKNASKARGR